MKALHTRMAAAVLVVSLAGIGSASYHRAICPNIRYHCIQ